MPEKKNPVRDSAHESRSIHDVGESVLDRLEKLGVLTGIVFQISILDDDHIPVHFSEATIESGTFALVFGLKEDADVVRLYELVDLVEFEWGRTVSQ